MRRSFQLMLSITLCCLFAWPQEPTTSTQQAPDNKTSMAKVYIYRYKQFVGSALTPSVYCDGNELARMENGRYFTVNLEAGKHTLTSNDKQSGIDLDLNVGEEYFIRVELVAGFAKGHGRLVLVPREQGIYELKSDKLKPLDANKVANKDVVSLDEPHLLTTALEGSKK